MELDSLIRKLRPVERAVLPVLRSHTELSAITSATKLQDIEVMRALQWLENKKALTIHSETKKIIFLDKNGLRYKKEGLPEKAFLNALSDEFKGLNVVTKKSKLSREEVNACLGVLRRRGAVDIQKGETVQLRITEQGKKLVEDLKRRKEFLTLTESKVITVTLTKLGQELASLKISTDVVNRLTTSLLKTGEWKEKEFRAYDVEINVPQKHAGKKHFENEALEYIKSIWLELGFTEMTGNYVQSAFWDLDALFVPQDHPAREMQDTFYLAGKAKLPELWKKVKEVHENGADSGSKGWRYTFSKEETEQLLLRTHTTVLSAQTLAKLKKEDLPAKFFAVGKVFRNEALDWKHLFEFYQVEGIVVDPHANLKHLKGYLTQFYKKMGFTKVRMRPAYFPYTEPSLEVDVFHPVKKEWVELGGAGIFRPEVSKALLGFDCPILAWGQGMGRI